MVYMPLTEGLFVDLVLKDPISSYTYEQAVYLYHYYDNSDCYLNYEFDMPEIRGIWHTYKSVQNLLDDFRCCESMEDVSNQGYEFGVLKDGTVIVNSGLF